MTHGSYWITPTIFFDPQTSSDGSSSTFAPRLIVPISRYVPPERSISIPSGMTCGKPTKSQTTSAPPPPVHVRTSATRSLRSATSLRLIVWSAPNARASSSRPGS